MRIFNEEEAILGNFQFHAIRGQLIALDRQ